MKLFALAAALALAGPAIAQDQTTTTTTTTAPATTDVATPDPVGGYQPDHPALSAQPQPGQQVIFQANTQTPDQAYPPPPPLAHYPLCKKGQFDNCRQRGG